MRLLHLNEDILTKIAPYLAAADLTSLSMTCRHFGAGNNATLSLVQKAARGAIFREQSKTEKAALVQYPGEGWIAVYHQLLMLRAPLIFDRLGGHLEYEDGDKSRVIARQEAIIGNSAISNHAMRGGKHYVEFSLAQGYFVWAGLMRPVPSPIPNGSGELDCFHPASPPNQVRLEILQRSRSERWGESNIDCCMYNFNSGQCMYRNWEENNAKSYDWEGQEGVHPGVLGLLLDLDAGTLTAYKDGRLMGVMCEGLAGEYCWVATMMGKSAISIERGAIPDDAV